MPPTDVCCNVSPSQQRGFKARPRRHWSRPCVMRCTLRRLQSSFAVCLLLRHGDNLHSHFLLSIFRLRPKGLEVLKFLEGKKGF